MSHTHTCMYSCTHSRTRIPHAAIALTPLGKSTAWLEVDRASVCLMSYASKWAAQYDKPDPENLFYRCAMIVRTWKPVVGGGGAVNMECLRVMKAPQQQSGVGQRRVARRGHAAQAPAKRKGPTVVGAVVAQVLGPARMQSLVAEAVHTAACGMLDGQLCTSGLLKHLTSDGRCGFLHSSSASSPALPRPAAITNHAPCALLQSLYQLAYTVTHRATPHFEQVTLHTSMPPLPRSHHCMNHTSPHTGHTLLQNTTSHPSPMSHAIIVTPNTL